MGRRRFPDEGSRLAFSIGPRPARYLRASIGAAVTIYTDLAATTLADIRTLEGVAITGSIIHIGEDSLFPDFLGPNDDRDTLYGKNGSHVSPLYALLDDSLDHKVGLLGPAFRLMSGTTDDADDAGAVAGDIVFTVVP